MVSTLTPQHIHILVVQLMIQMIGLHMEANWDLKLQDFYLHTIKYQVVTSTPSLISKQPHYSKW